MNEYRWDRNDSFNKQYTNQCQIVPYVKPVKKQHPILIIILTSVLTCILCMIIFSLAVVPNLKTKTIVSYTTDDRAKNDISNAIVGGTEGALSVTQINKIVGPSVVGIINKGNLGGFLNQTINLGSGSGVIITDDGYIITNNHVIENASDLTVILNTHEEYPAVIIGSDSKTDLAVIKINATGLTPAVLGNSSTLEVGELAVAIGNPLGQELAGSVTVGVVSATNRTITLQNRTLELIQTDAAINPGNSGGALVNCFGELIGINTVKLSSTSVEGIGFAIPISEAKPIIDDLMNKGRVTGRPIIGITGSDAPYGVQVESIVKGLPADKAGIQIGDLIIKVNGQSITTVNEINKIRDTFKPGDRLNFTIYRNGDLMDVVLTLEENTQ